MRTRYQFLGGGTVEAASAVELIEAMRAESKNPTESAGHFMKETADRCKLYNESEISCCDPETFIADLKRHGFLIEVEQ